MPRAKSVILSPAEKKEALAATKAALKEAKLETKKVMTFMREKNKLHTQTIKLEEKKLKECEKVVTGLEGKLAALTA